MNSLPEGRIEGDCRRAVATLTSLRSLAIEGFREIEDPSPLARLAVLTDLELGGNCELGGNWMSPRIGHLPSIAFLRQLSSLRALLLHTVIVDDKDYRPLLDLPALRRVRVMAVRGLAPPIEELKRALPWED